MPSESAGNPDCLEIGGRGVVNKTCKDFDLAGVQPECDQIEEGRHEFY